MPKWSEHANSRWAERFKNFNKDFEWESARTLTRKERAALRKYSPENGPKYMCGFNGRRYFISDRGIVFILTSNDVIVTVFYARLA